jgi:hypothetical protein
VSVLSEFGAVSHFAALFRAAGRLISMHRDMVAAADRRKAPRPAFRREGDHTSNLEAPTFPEYKHDTGGRFILQLQQEDRT